MRKVIRENQNLKYKTLKFENIKMKSIKRKVNCVSQLAQNNLLKRLYWGFPSN